MEDVDDYPLNCLDSLSDGFSGWFAVSDPNQCNDFCFWDHEQTTTNSTGEQQVTYTADPHETTAIELPDGSFSYWKCVFDSAGDGFLLSQATGSRWIDYVQGDGATFPHLRCHKGAGEKLKIWPGEIVKARWFWELWIILSSLIFVAEVGVLARLSRRRRNGRFRSSYEVLRTGSSLAIREEQSEFSEREDGVQALDIADRRESENMSDLKNPVLRTLSWMMSILLRKCSLRIVAGIALNLWLIFSISFASISLMEINHNPHFRESMEQLTPACSDPSLVCKRGNADIDKSFEKPDSGMDPFSYVVASDAQLYWFNGEFAQLGQSEIPPACSPSDSCSRCTAKHGRETNLRLRSAWESMMSGNRTGLPETVESLPTPHTLVMNGDLTAYFHPYEKRAYSKIYEDVQSLESYFPSLGNHDIEHMLGAMFGGDEWIGLPNCNMEHSLGYFKSGFCGMIPGFDADRIVGYDSSSLAYSWNEGVYHFVHTHYYPSFEIASMGYKSSIRWLRKDLDTASKNGYATILFVHAAQGLNEALEEVILGKNVKAIFAGHTHRCLMSRCESVYPVKESQVDSLNNSTQYEKCIPGAYDTCSVLMGENLIRVSDLADVAFPKEKLVNVERKDKPLCPKPSPAYINETDNSLLCRRVLYSEPYFPFDRDSSDESIPIIWSGSASFSTFLRTDFYHDRFVINAMTSIGDEVARYVDVRDVPNAVYPYHDAADLEEKVIYIND